MRAVKGEGPSSHLLSRACRNFRTSSFILVMFRPTWRTEPFSSVYAKSNGYTVSGPTCFFPMMPGVGEIGLSRALSVSHSPLPPSPLPRPCVLLWPPGGSRALVLVCPWPSQKAQIPWGQVLRAGNTGPMVARDKALPLWGREVSCCPAPVATRSPSPVRTPAWPNSKGRLCTRSKELKWWTSWCRPYIPF